MNEIQKQLNALYLDFLKKLISDEELFSKLRIERITSPLFMNIDAPYSHYVESDLKILYVGKENNGWMSRNNREQYGLSENFTESADIFLAALLELYKNFNLGRNYRKPFYTFLDLLLDQFRSNDSKPGILWSNLIRVDCVDSNDLNESHDLKKKIIKLDGNKILREEIAILKPDVVVFLTGPRYDNFLRETFPGIRLTQINNLGVNEMSMLEHEALPKASLRVYHPDAYKYRGAEYKSMVSKAIHNCYINSSVR